MTRLLAVSLVVLAATVALPAAASATVVPQRSIAGIRLGMSEEQVRAELGEPSETVRESNEFGPYIDLIYRARSLRMRVRLQGEEEVTLVSTSSRRQRTRRGIRVGSHERSLRRHVRGVRCETFMRVRRCVVGREEPGRTITVFHIAGERITRITLGIIID